MQTTNNNVNVFAKYKSQNSDLLPPPPPPPQITPSTLIVFSIGIIIFCFLGFTILFFCRCCFVNISSTTTLVHLSPNASPYRGLDPSTLQTFPTFLYATVKDLRKEKYSLECAVCLAEFDNDSMLRLLTVCYHVFHQDCIDLWLRSHKTCPVCRTDLESPTNEDEKAPEQDTNVGEERRDHDHDHDHDHIHSCDHDRDHACIDVREDDGDQIHKEDEGGGDEQGASAQEQEQNIFARSHSTGHSVVMVREGTEGRDGADDNYNKYTLRLPEHVALKIVRGGHIYSKSCSSYKDMTMVGAPCSNCGYVQTLLDGSSHNDTKTN